MIKHYRSMGGKVSHTLTVGRWQWDTADWSLSRRDLEAKPPVTSYIGIFAIRCCVCHRFTIGCKDHYFCGLCESCRSRTEDDDTQDV
jgi:hypothetical protein